MNKKWLIHYMYNVCTLIWESTEVTCLSWTAKNNNKILLSNVYIVDTVIFNDLVHFASIIFTSLWKASSVRGNQMGDDLSFNQSFFFYQSIIYFNTLRQRAKKLVQNTNVSVILIWSQHYFHSCSPNLLKMLFGWGRQQQKLI